MNCGTTSGQAELDKEDKLIEEQIYESFNDISLTMNSENKTFTTEESLGIETKNLAKKSACEKTASFLSEMGFYSDVSKESSTVSVISMQHLKKKRKKKRKHLDFNEEGIVVSADFTGNEVKKQNNETAEVDEALKKYWYQRYRLFSRFDEGIKLDHGTEFYVFKVELLLELNYFNRFVVFSYSRKNRNPHISTLSL